MTTEFPNTHTRPMPGPTNVELDRQISVLRGQLAETVDQLNQALINQTQRITTALASQDAVLAEIREQLPSRRVPAVRDELAEKILETLASMAGLPVMVKFTAATMAETLGLGREMDARNQVNNRLGQLAKAGKISSEKADGHNRTYWAKAPKA